MNLVWYWHKCWIHNTDGEKYYMCTMGEYQMVIREHWEDKVVNIAWKPMVAKWNNDTQIYDELVAADANISLEVRKELNETMEYLQKWYITHVLADKLILGVIDATPLDLRTRTDS